jgi:inhibitor of growth protein 5
VSSAGLVSHLSVSPSDKKAEIDILAAEYISTVKTLSPDQRVEHLQKIQSAYSKCKEYSDDKVQLAMQTYEMVRGQGRGWGSHLLSVL